MGRKLSHLPPIAAADATDPQPLRIALDPSVCEGLRIILSRDPALFALTPAADADCILFGTDEIGYVRRNPLYAAHRSKCFCISESDTPSFFLPGLYAANRRGLLTRSRAATISYCVSLIFKKNAALDREAAAATRKTLLYSFMGGMNSWPRRRMLRHVPSREDTHIEATDQYNHWAREQDASSGNQQQRYGAVMSASKFIVCPRGCGISSYRLFEAMSLGIAPVIISDAWQPVSGMDWSFALFVGERDVGRLDAIVRAHADGWRQRGEAAYAAHRALFGEDVIAATLRRELDRVRHARRSDRESIMSTLAWIRFTRLRAYWAVYKFGKLIVLRLLAAGGWRFPYALHQPAAVQIKRQNN